MIMSSSSPACGRGAAMAPEPLSVLRQKGHAGNGVAFLIEKETSGYVRLPEAGEVRFAVRPFSGGTVFFVGHIIF